MTITALLTDLCGATGGIASFNRSLATALSHLATEFGWYVQLLVLNDPPDPTESGFRETLHTAQFDRNRKAFVATAVRYALTSDIVIVGHVNFVPVAPLLRITHPAVKILLIAYGIEVWRPLNWLRRSALRWVDRTVAISAATRDRAVMVNGFDKGRMTIVPCTLDPGYLGYADRLRQNADLTATLPAGCRVLTVARLNAADAYKGVDVIIEAMPSVLSRVPDARLIIVGDGNDRLRLEYLTHRLGVDHSTVFAGHLTTEALAAYYSACDLFVLPSVGEGFGIAFLEAMYQGRACIGVDAGGVREVITPGATGYLVPPGDRDALADAIVELLTHPERRKAFGEAARQRVKRQFSFDHFRGAIAQLMQSVAWGGVS